jgi:hypothetical protein
MDSFPASFSADVQKNVKHNEIALEFQRKLRSAIYDGMMQITFEAPYFEMEFDSTNGIFNDLWLWSVRNGKFNPYWFWTVIIEMYNYDTFKIMVWHNDEYVELLKLMDYDQIKTDIIKIRIYVTF